jgi:sugar phosphate isomerase/epimerase
MHPRLSANVTMAWNWDLGRCIETWARLGIPAIGITLTGLESYGRRKGIRQLKDAGLKIANYQQFQPYRLADPSEFPARRDAALEYLDIAAEIEADCIYTLTGPRGALSWDEAGKRVVDQTLQLLPALHERNLRLALEPIHPLRQDLTFLNLASDTLDLLRAIGDPSVGYVFDFWHLWWQRPILELARTSAAQIFSVQVSDHKEVTMRTLDRAMIGQGITPIDDLMRALDAGGYNRYYDLEIISPDNEAIGYENAVAQAVADLNRLLDRLQIT